MLSAALAIAKRYEGGGGHHQDLVSPLGAAAEDDPPPSQKGFLVRVDGRTNQSDPSLVRSSSDARPSASRLKEQESSRCRRQINPRHQRSPLPSLDPLSCLVEPHEALAGLQVCEVGSLAEYASRCSGLGVRREGGNKPHVIQEFVILPGEIIWRLRDQHHRPALRAAHTNQARERRQLGREYLVRFINHAQHSQPARAIWARLGIHEAVQILIEGIK